MGLSARGEGDIPEPWDSGWFSVEEIGVTTAGSLCRERAKEKKKNLTVQQSRKYAGIWILATTSHWWVWPGTGSSPFWASVQQFKNKGLAQMSSTGPSSSALLLGLTIWGIIPYLWFLLQDVMGKKERPSALSWPKLLSDFGGWLCSSEHWDSLCREPC